jgi:ectoine hydroxylase-related dioxygenase (phytanoyl-CoA dioxygenase family)
MAEVRSIDRNTPAEEAMAILKEDGAVVYRNLVDEDVIDQVRRELEPYLERAYNGEGEFWGYKTKRISSLIAKSKTYGEELATNPRILAVMDQLLLPHCARYHLHVTQAVAIGPGEGQQIIHRDDGLMPFRHPGPQSLCNTMWALTDFTEENGATNVILGSHDWDDDTYPDENSEISHAAMPKGSCMIYLGSVYHGGGKNVTEDEYRIGMITGYSLGWLRQEENQYLAVPPAVAKNLREDVQHLIGYHLHDIFLGWVEGHDPHVVLEDRYSDVMPAAPEGGEYVEDTTLFKTAVLVEPSRH